MKNGPAARKKILLPAVLLAAAAVGVCLLVWVMGALAEQAAYHPPAFAAEAAAGTPELTAKDGYGPVTSNFGYTFALCAAPVSSGGSLGLYFTDPAGSGVWLMAEVLREDGTSAGLSGVIRPGEYLAAVGLDSPLPAGAAFSLRVYAFEPDTYRSAGTTLLNGLHAAG